MTGACLARFAKVAWAAPCSLVGLAAAGIALCFGARAHVVGGVLEVALTDPVAMHARLSRWLWFQAITLGHVVLAAGRDELEQSRAHERVHVRQYERWGLAFFIAYPASSLWQALNGRRAYWDNCFEVEARRLSGDAEPPRKNRGLP